MAGFLPERRRSPRVALTPGSWLTAPYVWSVQLVDLSLGGVAFVSPHQIAPGRKLTVRTTLGSEAFSGLVQVCWTRARDAGRTGPAQFEIGARFLALEEKGHRALRSFLKLTPLREQA